MLENNKNASIKPKILKLTRDREFGNAFHPVLDKLLQENYECVGTIGEFLYDLFGCIEDLGIFIEKDLSNGETRFTGNSHTALILPNNKIKFEDDYGSFCYEMNLDEFLKVNKEYHELYRKGATDIIFKAIDGKVILEGFWSNF